MQDRPTVIELLQAAQQALAGKVVPQLSGDARKEALMVANVLQIAARSIELREDAARAERAALLRVYPQGVPGASAADELLELNRRFAADLRAGCFDSDATLRELAGDVVLELTALKLRESNPKFLAAAGAL